MKSLQIIQKTVRVFQILCRVAMILCFVGAGLALLGATVLFTGVAQSQFLGSLVDLGELTGMQALAAMLCSLTLCLIDGLLLSFAGKYLARELQDGTPFTEGGATQLRDLGIRTIVLPLVAMIICAVISGCLDVEYSEYLSNGASVSLGIGLILFSFVLRYGAELEAARPQPEATEAEAEEPLR